MKGQECGLVYVYTQHPLVVHNIQTEVQNKNHQAVHAQPAWYILQSCIVPTLGIVHVMEEAHIVNTYDIVVDITHAV